MPTFSCCSWQFSSDRVKALCSSLYLSSCRLTLLLSVLRSLSFLLTTIIDADDSQLFFRSTHSTFTQAFRIFKTLFNRSLPKWLLIFLLLTPLRLNSCSSDSKTYLPKYTTLHLTFDLRPSRRWFESQSWQCLVISEIGDRISRVNYLGM